LVVILLDSVIFFIPSLKLSPETEFGATICCVTRNGVLQGHGTPCPYSEMVFVVIYFVRARSLCKVTARRASTL
jgi:hypothetical protein